jgi:hypothetical protein
VFLPIIFLKDCWKIIPRVWDRARWRCIDICFCIANPPVLNIYLTPASGHVSGSTGQQNLSSPDLKISTVHLSGFMKIRGSAL